MSEKPISCGGFKIDNDTIIEENGVLKSTGTTGRVIYQDPIVILDTTELSFSKDGDNDWYSADPSSLGVDLGNLPENALYTVVWDGVEYPCYYYYIYEQKTPESTVGVYSHTLGNVKPFGYAPVNDNNFPFLIKAPIHRKDKNQ